MKRDHPDCCTCGACCIAPYDQESFCDLEIKDEERLGAKLVRRYVIRPSLFDQLVYGHPGGAIKTICRKQPWGPFKGCEMCACSFLKGSVYLWVECRVYDDRPRACREAIVPGDSACRELRRSFKEQQKSLERGR